MTFAQTVNHVFLSPVVDSVDRSGRSWNPINYVVDLGDSLKQTIKDAVQEVIIDMLKALGRFVLEASYGVTLVGGGFLILLYVTGYKEPIKYLALIWLIWIFAQFILVGIV